nr:hypothetical protein [uncultured Desulfobacter sp.]
MGHQDRGNYAKKRAGVQLDPALTTPIMQASSNGKLACASAHRLAKTQKCSPSHIGTQADLLEFRITQCQLGLFGYAKGKKNFNPDSDMTPQLKDRILECQADGQITCKTCWELALEFKMSKLDMGSVCEQLEIRIKPCQLGVF